MLRAIARDSTGVMAMADVTVNIQDYGAVPGSGADCSAAFQRAVDDLAPDPATPQIGGGTIIVPGAAGSYLVSRPVIVDQPYVRIVGDDPTTSIVQAGSASPPFIFGVARKVLGAQLADDYWVDLLGLLDSTTVTAAGQRWGYRTTSASQGAGVVTLPCTPFSFGPPDTSYWSSVSQLTVDFVIRNNAMPWTNQTLFGLLDANQQPSPFYATIDSSSGAPVLRFVLRTVDGLTRAIRVPITASEPVLRCSLQLDFAAGTVLAWVDRLQVTPDLTLINDGWLTGDRTAGQQPPALAPNWYASFHLGTVAFNDAGLNPKGSDSTIDGRIGEPGDLTFGALRLSTSALYQDLGAGKPQQTSTGAVTDLDLLSPPPTGFGCCLPMDEPMHRNPAGVPDLQLPWHCTTANGYGTFLLNSLGPDTDSTIAGNGMAKINVTGFSGAPGTNYAQTIGLGQVYDFFLDDVAVYYGAQGLSSFVIAVSYPIRMTSCLFEAQTDAAIYGNGQLIWATDIELKYFQRTAVKAIASNVIMRNVFCTDTHDCVSVVRLYQSNGQFDNWTVDMEAFLPSDSYFWASLGYQGGGPNQLSIRDTQGGNAGPHTAAVRLVSNETNAGLASANTGIAGWCTIERSFNQYFNHTAQAVVAVDSPLWQGLYQGLPSQSVPLAVNTATLGGSARIGTGATPPAAAWPPPVALTGVDPILALPGLLGYYRADALSEADGGPVADLTDLGPAGNKGTATGSPVIWESGVINGHAAFRFGGRGSGFTFPAMEGSSGAVTMFFVAKLPPGVSTSPGHPGSVQNYGTLWQRSAPAAQDVSSVSTPVSELDWAVYAVRCTSGSARVLQSWVNGHPGERARRDDLGPVAWSSPFLGANNYGWLTSQWSVAVICDAALADDQIGQITQFLLNQFQIPV